MKSINSRKGIILAGGKGTRLHPTTLTISKQLIPIFNKPMIYYAISVLMYSNIREILIITTPRDLEAFKYLLGDGSNFGLIIKYKVQQKPEGLAQAFLIAEEFIEDKSCALILGDNFFHGNDLIPKLRNASIKVNQNTIFVSPVKNPSRYGVVNFDNEGLAKDIQEKPTNPKTNFAVTGLYFYNNDVIEKAKNVKPSKRGELEITSINNMYLKEKSLRIEILGRGIVWLDTGTFESLHEASSYIRTIESRQGLKVGCLEEIAWRFGWIDDNKLKYLSDKMQASSYGEYLKEILKEKI